MIMCVLLCYPVSIRIYYQQGGRFLVFQMLWLILTELPICSCNIFQGTVYSSGYVLWVPPVFLASSCPLDLTDFPHDTQVCELPFGSWTYSKKEVGFFMCKLQKT